jgi:hypothetical protein
MIRGTDSSFGSVSCPPKKIRRATELDVLKGELAGNRTTTQNIVNNPILAATKIWALRKEVRGLRGQLY